MATGTLGILVNFTQGAVGDDATHFHLYDAATGGNLVHTIAITGNPDELMQNERYQIPANMIVLTQNAATPGDTEAGARNALRGRVERNLWVAVATGTASGDELSTPGRQALVAANWTIA